jgi:hypothetical protein
MAKWQRFKVKVRKDLGPLQRQAVALEIIEHIKKRTSQGRDKSGNPWKGKAGIYSKSYQKSLDFKIAKGSSKVVNLELSSEMMNSMKVISHRSGELLIGYDRNNSELNGKVEGNRLGTYGKSSPIRGKSRDFLGIERSKLTEIQNKYDYKREDKEKVLERIESIKNILGET